MTTRFNRRPLVTGLAGFAVALSGLAVLSVAGPAQADVSTKISAYPYTQPWSDGGLITTDDDWSGVAGAQGYRGDDLTTATGTDPQTITADGSTTPTDVVANAPANSTAGGVLEINGETIAMQGSGTADAPSLVFHLDLTGQPGATFSFDAKDLDASADNAVQQVAVQYRVGPSGDYINLPTGYVADATDAGSATKATPVSVALPGSTTGEADVFVRVLTTNAAGSDELVGIDDISITTGSGPAPVSATDPADVTATAGTAISDIVLTATAGTPPYSWEVSGLPAGLSETSDGVIGGTPTAAGMSTVTVTVTDSATPTAATDSEQFTITVNPAGPLSIAEIQGTGNASTLAGTTVTTEGVVTAKYPGGTGAYNGIYIQTAGSGGTTNDTPGASDAIFVFGNNSQPAGVEIGDSVEVTGVVSEFSGLTEITPGAGGVVEVPSLGTVTPRATVPGTDCALPGTACLTGAALSSAREAFEGELFQPTGDYTVTDVHDGSAYNGTSFSSSFFGEIGLAAESDMPLVTPTEVIDAQATADIAARKAYNDAHRMVLDDGAGLTYWNTGGTGAMDQPLPWFTEDNQVRVGAGVTFPKPVVMEWRNNTWKLQPQTRVTDAGADRVAFEQTRPTQPEDVGGDLKLGTFNVLNYFTTLGATYGGCTSFNDREGNPIAVNSCPGTGPRGAWNQASFDRQQTKIVNAINTMDADIVALEEIENSGIVDGGDRDEAVETLVAALNADAGSTRWAFVDSPTAVDPGEDVIRTAMIYNPAAVELVGDSELFYDTAFNNAREPFAQTFKAAGTADADGFAVIANHFKSKGSGVDDGTGQGLANPDRIAQANALAGFADGFAAANGVEKVFLTGDFNANSMEDPVQVLTGAGYTSLESTDDPNEESYNFDGQIQSLDHVFANEAAEPDVTGVDIWTINSYESQYYEYSRFNYNIRQLYTPAPFRASDHNPEIVGIHVPGTDPVATSVTASGGPVTFGTDWTAHVTVNPSAATGTVEVLDGNTSLGTATLTNGTADITIDGTALQPGEHTLNVRYLGDAEHAPSANTFSVTVNPDGPAETTTALTVGPMTYGTPGSANVKVTSANPLSGTVELREGATVIGTASVAADGTAAITIPGTALTVGSHTLTAHYLGDDDNAPSQGSAQVQVAKAVSTTTVDIDPSKAVVRQDKVTLTATVSATGVNPTGQVVFSANGVEIGTSPLVDGQAALTVGPPPSVGTIDIAATYQGDATTAPSTSEPAQLEVVKADVRLRAEVKPKPVIVDRTNTRLKIEVTAPGQQVTGKVEVTWKGKTRTVTLDGGKAAVELGKWGSTGEKTVRVRYLGSNLANPETKVVTFQVRPKPGR